MTNYTDVELKEALRAIISTLNKCEKARLNLKEGSAQQTLLVRRIKALHISIDLIERELVSLMEN